MKNTRQAIWQRALDGDKKIRNANARALQKKRKLQHRPSLTRGDMGDRYSLFRPATHRGGRIAEPNDVCFRCGSKGHVRRDYRVRIPIGIQPGGTRIQAVQQPVQWGLGGGAGGGPAFPFTSPGAVPFTQTGSTRNTIA